MKLFRRIFAVASALSLFVAGLVVGQPAQAIFKSTYGTEFWVNFDQNFGGDSEQPGLFLAGSSAGTATITWPDATTDTVTLIPGGVASVDATEKIKTAGKYVTGTDVVGDFAVKITSTVAITVYLSNLRQASSDASIAYPSEYLGTTYRVFTAPGQTDNGPERFSVTAAEAGTTAITVTLAAGSSGTSPRVAGTPYTVSLNEGETYTLTGNELAGTLISSTQKVTVSASIQCVNFGFGACDHTTEFMTPVETWGKSYILPGSRNSMHDDEFWVMAHENNTEVAVNGGSPTTLQAGQYFSITNPGSNALAIKYRTLTSTKPVLILQGLDAGAYAGSGPTQTGDPAVVLVQPTAQFLNDAIISTPATGFPVNYVVIVAKTSDVTGGLLKLNGDVLAAAGFTVVAGTDFSIGSFDIAVGAHRITSTNGFGAYVTGFGQANSYAYSGGSGLVDLVQFPGGVAEVGYQTVEEIVSGVPATSDVSRDVDRGASNYNGPVVVASPNQWQPGATVNFAGSTLTPIEKVVIDGVECKFTIVNGEIRVTLPPGIKPGTYDMKVSGDFGELTIQDAVRVAGSISAELIGKK
jgi:hypothetical protein